MLQLIPVTSPDLKLIKDLAHEIWPVTYGHIISSAQMEYMLEKFYDSDYLAAQINDRRRIMLVKNDGATQGFVDIEDRGADQFIHKFYLKTNSQSKGLGSSVMALLIQQENPDHQSLRLQVNRQNYKAINFYFKNGFVIEQVLDLDIGNDFFMNDFLMVKHF